MKKIGIPIVISLILSFPAILFGKVGEIDQNPLVNYQGASSAIVNGTVNVITGNYNEYDVDISLPGEEPLTFARSYSSFDTQRNTMQYGWHNNHDSRCEPFLLVTHGFGPNAKKRYFRTWDFAHISAEGSEQKYEAEKNREKDKIHYSWVKPPHQYGMTNLGGEEISAATQPKNNKMAVNAKANRVELILGTGDKEIYNRRPDSKDEIYDLVLRDTPSRRRFYYGHYKDGLLKAVTLTDSKEVTRGSIRLTKANDREFNNNPHYRVTSTCGHEVTYRFTHRAGRNHFREFLLESVESPHFPTESYEYEEFTHNRSIAFRVTRRTTGKSQYLATKYHKAVEPQYKGGVLLNPGSGRFADRVAFQEAPVGSNDNPIKIYRFEYREGQTRVFDAYNRMTSYHYKDNRLHTTIRYLGNRPFRKEKNYWAAEKTSNAGNLMAISVADGADKELFLRRYDYDARGNIISEKIFGNLTGNNRTPLLLHSYGAPRNQGHDCLHTTYTYKKDQFDLLMSEQQGERRVDYTYYPNTRLIKSALTYYGDAIVMRAFYDYDAGGACIKELVDNGSEVDRENLSGVTKRKIQIRKMKSQGLLLPNSVEERYLDLASGEEKLIRKIDYCYDSFGRVIKETLFDDEGVFAGDKHFAYDKMGNLVKEVNALGETITCKYDERKNKIEESGPRPGFKKCFVYDRMNRLIKEETHHSDGSVATKQYRYDYVHNKTAEIDEYGQTTRFVYDCLNRLHQVHYPIAYHSDGKTVASVEKYEHDALDRITTKIDRGGQKTKLSYTLMGKPVTIAYPDGSREIKTYDVQGNLVEHIERNDVKTVFTNDWQGRCIRKQVFSPEGEFLYETSSTYDLFDLLTETDAAGTTTYYGYNDRSQLTSLIKDSSVTRFEYDSLGRLSKTIEESDNGDALVSIRLYDLLDRVVEERIENGVGDVQGITQYGYDYDGNKVSTITYNQYGTNCELKEYDSRGNLIRTVDALGYETLTRYRYDYVNEKGQKVSYRETIDPSGNQLIVIKDTLGNDVSFTVKDRFGIELQRYEIDCNQNGKAIKRTEHLLYHGNEDQTVITCWQYDGENRLIACLEAVGTPLQKESRVIYNSKNQKEKVITPDRRCLFYSYDSLGRLEKLYSSAGDVAYRYHYDQLSRPIEVYDEINGVSNKKRYDSLGNVVEEELPNGLKMAYAYDQAGRVIGYSLPDGSSVENSYNGHYLASVAKHTADGTQQYVHHYLDYDLTGKISEAKLIGEAGSVKISYDQLGRETSITSDHYNEEQITYDEKGALLSRTVEDFSGQTNDEYRYDFLGQLTEERGTYNHDYACDSAYNRRIKDGKEHLINELYQLLDDGESCYCYNKNGHLTNRKTADTEQNYTYDSLGRLICVQTNETTIEYLYDDCNRRHTRKHYRNGCLIEEERYLLSGRCDIGTVVDDQLVNLRLLGTGKGAEIAASVAIELAGKPYAVIHDHNGSITTLIDPETSEIFESYRYSAFGEEEASSTLNPWRFSSKRKDPFTGYVYFGKRDYDPVSGRWMTPDPIGHQDGPNLYAYVHNNPLTHIDLWGEFDNRTFSDYDVTCRKNFMFKEAAKYHKKGQIFFAEKWEYFHKEKSHRYELKNEGRQCKEIGDHKYITSIFGIKTGKKGSLECNDYLSALGGGVNIRSVSNASDGLINDVTECQFLKRYWAMTPPTNELVSTWMEIIKNDPNAKILHVCHSQGALHTRNALNKLPKELRKHIQVVAIAPAGYILDELCERVKHFVSPKDYVPGFDKEGREQCKHTTKMLTPLGNTFLDHEFKSLTYQESLQREYDKFMDL